MKSGLSLLLSMALILLTSTSFVSAAPLHYRRGVSTSNHKDNIHLALRSLRDMINPSFNGLTQNDPRAEGLVARSPITPELSRRQNRNSTATTNAGAASPSGTATSARLVRRSSASGSPTLALRQSSASTTARAVIPDPPSDEFLKSRRHIPFHRLNRGRIERPRLVSRDTEDAEVSKRDPTPQDPPKPSASNLSAPGSAQDFGDCTDPSIKFAPRVVENKDKKAGKRGDVAKANGPTENVFSPANAEEFGGKQEVAVRAVADAQCKTLEETCGASVAAVKACRDAADKAAGKMAADAAGEFNRVMGM
ncbi:hypothetical protein K402DRAFT_404947 [Aulographum hederae CBS 113979]|uniref:Uncharacterized protein n=1 Tax=Aulographum hederae CBS 113979 TaxID=1176131 RepID=A0A6G1GYF9_9PEZI|nr:hypothetical protein K402DRAFT_404947 [Aulographum hederae CBS 113979]